MAADFMVRPVRYLNKGWALLCWFICWGCTAPAKEVPAATVAPTSMTLSDTSSGLQRVGDAIHYQGQPFTGTIFGLYPGSADTLFTNSFLLGREHGIWQKFYPAHQLKERRQFDNGAKTGELIAWWPNGSKQLQYFFVAGEYEGSCQEWDSTGVLVKAMHYKAGQEEGLQQMFYSNGKVRSNYVVNNGRRYGLLGTKNCINVKDSVFKN